MRNLNVLSSVYINLATDLTKNASVHSTYGRIRIKSNQGPRRAMPVLSPVPKRDLKQPKLMNYEHFRREF